MALSEDAQQKDKRKKKSAKTSKPSRVPSDNTDKNALKKHEKDGKRTKAEGVKDKENRKNSKKSLSGTPKTTHRKTAKREGVETPTLPSPDARPQTLDITPPTTSPSRVHLAQKLLGQRIAEKLVKDKHKNAEDITQSQKGRVKDDPKRTPGKPSEPVERVADMKQACSSPAAIRSVILDRFNGPTSVTLSRNLNVVDTVKRPRCQEITANTDDSERGLPDEKVNSCETSKRRKALTPQSPQHAMSINVLKATMEMRMRSYDDQSTDSVARSNVEANRCLREFADMATKLSMHSLSKEFSQKIRPIRPFDAQCKTCKTYEDKNRYDDIFCLDETRVLLCDTDNRPLPADKNYIHANYVSSPDLSHCFVVTQAPMRSTAADFWHMVWQLQSPLIIMLCDYFENNRHKCHCYLPAANKMKQYRHVTVHNAGAVKHNHGALIETRLRLSVTNSARPLELRHFRYINWPDHGVPNDFQTIFRLLKEARIVYGTTVIHCSAGIGRSGTLVAIEFCLGVLRNGKPLDVKACVEHLRRQRAQCVQTTHQYLFIFRALLELADVNALVDHKQFKNFCVAYERATRVKTSVLK